MRVIHPLKECAAGIYRYGTDNARRRPLVDPACGRTVVPGLINDSLDLSLSQI